MKQVIAATNEEIIREINRIIDNRIPLLFCQKGAPHSTVLVKSIDNSKEHSYLIVTKQGDFSLSATEGFFFYKFPGHLTRCFKGSNIREHKNLLALALPAELLENQRRKFPRVPTAGNSLATFALAEKQRLRYCSVLDVSLEGAKIRGGMANIRTSQMLRPFTMILGMRHSVIEETVAVSEATVAWVTAINEDEGLMGVHFRKGTVNREQLDHYIHMRLLEGAKYGT